MITFTSPDATSTNTLRLRPTGSQIEFHDPTVDGGIDPGHCAPGELSSPGIFGEVVIQAFCPAAGVQAVRVDLGARDDTATVSLAIPVLISGGPRISVVATDRAGDSRRAKAVTIRLVP